MSITAFEQLVYTSLETLAIPYIRREHPPVYTVDQAREYDSGIPGAHCKNLFLRNKKGDRHFLAILEASTSVHLRGLGDRIGAGGLSLASPDRLLRIMGLEPGSVGPFGLLNPAAKDVTVLLENRLRSFSQIGFHPNTNTATLTIAREDFERFLSHLGNPILWIDLSLK